MKNIILMSILMTPLLYFGQVGINTTSPAATLDIVAKNSTGTSTNIDGLIVPRIDRQRAQNMTGITTSTLVFINSIATGTQTGIAANIDTTGYYYYDGTVWVKLHNPTNATNLGVNIYNSDGTLTGNRIVTQNANTLAFTGTAVNAFSVAGSAFSVDASNKRVGIGTIAPSNYLHIAEPNQNTGISTSFVKGATITATGGGASGGYAGPGMYFENLTNASGEKIFKLNYTSNSNNEGILNFQTVSDDASLAVTTPMVLTHNGKVGVGITTPLTRFHVDGGESRFSSGTSTWGLVPTTGGTTGASNSLELIDRINNVRRIVFNDNGDVSLGGIILSNSGMGAISIRSGNVGINTATPQKLFHVNGSLQVTNELNVGGNATTAGSAGTSGQVLISNGTGTAPSWKSPSTISGTVFSASYVQGTTALTVNQGTVADVPGVTLTLTVPSGSTQTFLFTIMGYAISNSSTDSQGAFYLLQNGTKISSAYASMVSGSQLVRLPMCTTFLKAVTLSAGTYTFKIQYSSWSGNGTVNFVPSGYSGYNGDTEAMLTKMQVIVYNN
ncbi:hypothetical protein [Chryseobacterium sp. MMS23-Vi53]|uniref:hypothetical protein n=1 Tax=Chryseobacterium sp. MMS23-Vi53 TaxID=3386644 RepID=UPI0039ECBC1C